MYRHLRPRGRVDEGQVPIIYHRPGVVWEVYRGGEKVRGKGAEDEMLELVVWGFVCLISLGCVGVAYYWEAKYQRLLVLYYDLAELERETWRELKKAR